MELLWLWALHAPDGRETLRSSNKVATLEIAKAEFRGKLEAVEAWAGLKETAE